MGRGRVWVVVLGDFGRSPRMQYHTLSLASQVR
jgi:beta-1,4-mannosyltransferase